jgi:hypothetical protein
MEHDLRLTIFWTVHLVMLGVFGVIMAFLRSTWLKARVPGLPATASRWRKLGAVASSALRLIFSRRIWRLLRALVVDGMVHRRQRLVRRGGSAAGCVSAVGAGRVAHSHPPGTGDHRCGVRGQARDPAADLHDRDALPAAHPQAGRAVSSGSSGCGGGWAVHIDSWRFLSYNAGRKQKMNKQ